VGAVAGASGGGGACGAQSPVPPVRKAGNLTVESPPRKPSERFGSRMRTHIEGALTASAQRFWVGIEVPSFVQLAAGTLELFLLDRVQIGDPEPAAPGAAVPAPPNGFLAFYRDPYDASSCGLSGSSENCAFGAALYHCSGKLQWVLTLNAFLSRRDHLEIQDARFADGVLYFNEACQSYSKDAGGKCSSLVALDPAAKKVIWRSAPLLSNNAFIVANSKYIVSGYGFTAEPDALFVVRRSDGKMMHRAAVTTAHEHMRIADDGSLLVTLYDNKRLRFAMSGFEGENPKLVKLPEDKSRPRTMPDFDTRR
jgi:hypothetical protein